MNTKKILLIGSIISSLIIMTFAIFVETNREKLQSEAVMSQPEKVVTSNDPKSGPVLLQGGQYDSDNLHTTISKRCDGANLVYISTGYRSGGIAVVPNSPECIKR